MKNFILFSFLFLMASTAHATAAGPDCWEVQNVAPNDVLNIREAPNAKAKMVGTIPPNGKSISNSNNIMCPDDPATKAPPECLSGWQRITYQGVTGWVNGKFLKGSGDCQ